MAEIKHTFTAGKMNKDVDERLVPNGEYRHAQNIQVRTTDGSDSGVIQRFKREKFAETRKAKIRLSNIKMEEFTQVLKGLGKPIK